MYRLAVCVQLYSLPGPPRRKAGHCRHVTDRHNDERTRDLQNPWFQSLTSKLETEKKMRGWSPTTGIQVDLTQVRKRNISRLPAITAHGDVQHHHREPELQGLQ
jgi:ribosomal protein S13